MRYLYLFLLFFNFSLVAQTTNNKCINKVFGQVLDKSTDLGIPYAVINIQNNAENSKTLKTDFEGKFSFDLPCEDTRYTISTTVENYTASTKLLFLNKDIARKHEAILPLYPIKEFVQENSKKRIYVESIHFLPNETSIDSESAVILDQVYDILVKYPYLKIEVGFHTDSRGIEAQLLELTSKRAESCANYLINKGIDEIRITSKGYGATQLLNECAKGVRCSNSKHLVNRRSEFIVIP